MKTLKDFLGVVNLNTWVICLLALGSTFLSQHFGLRADIPTGLIGLAVVFPIVFSINAAYRRREEALINFAAIKSHSVALYYAHRDWLPGEPGSESGHTERLRGIIECLLEAIRIDLGPQGRTDSSLREVFRNFSRLSGSHEELRRSGLSGSEISRANQFVSKMIIDFERMRRIATYRTPVTLRAYSRVFLNLFPVAFGPYFAYLNSDSFPIVGYLVAVLYSVVLVTLDNLQQALEDPFDDIGADDIELNVMDAYRPLLEEPGLHPTSSDS